MEELVEAISNSKDTPRTATWNRKANQGKINIIGLLEFVLEIDIVNYELNPGQWGQENMFYMNEVIILYLAQQSKSESNMDIIQTYRHQVYPGLLAHAPNFCTWETEAGGFQVSASLSHIARSCLKQTNRAGSMAQHINHFCASSEGEGQSSNHQNPHKGQMGMVVLL